MINAQCRHAVCCRAGVSAQRTVPSWFEEFGGGLSIESTEAYAVAVCDSPARSKGAAGCLAAV